MSFTKLGNTVLMYQEQMYFYVLEMSDWKLKIENIPFIKAFKNMKYIGINVLMLKDVYTKNYKMLLSEIKEYVNKYSLFVGLGDSVLLRCQ